MKLIYIILMTTLVINAFAEDNTSILDSIKDEVVKQQTANDKEQLPQIKEDKEDKKQNDKTISFSVRHKSCISQGFPRDICDNLNNRSTTEKYDIKNPQIPSIDDAKNDLFLNLNIKH